VRGKGFCRNSRKKKEKNGLKKVVEVPPVFPDLIQVLRDLKVTHPSLERLESDSSKS
jgi:hypothetical protein